MEMGYRSRFSALHRILHWSMALLMLVLFFTGFLRMYWMNKKTIINAIDLNTQGVDLASDQKLAIVRTIMGPMWEWHVYAAYVVLFAFFVRVIYMLAKGIKFPHPFVGRQPVKERFQGFIYALFYWCVFATIVTGFYLKWGDGEWKAPMEMVHKWAIYWFPIFFVLHLGGIVIGELTNKRGVVSKMIGGR